MKRRLTMIGLVVSWIASWHTGMRVFRQKLTPEYHPLPGLIDTHAHWGLAWAALLAWFGWLGCSGLGQAQEESSESTLSRVPALALGFFSSTVVYTGHGLKKGKPTGVWVHVGLALIATGLGLGLWLKHLRDDLA